MKAIRFLPAVVLSVFFSLALTNDKNIPLPSWKHLSTVTGDIPVTGIGNQVAALIHDLDGDGYNDFVIASYEKIAWFRFNPGKKGWTRHIIEPGNRRCAPQPLGHPTSGW